LHILGKVPIKSRRVCHSFMFHSVFLAVFAASLALLVTVSNKRVQIVTVSNEREQLVTLGYSL
jgi:uncharacterized protein YcfL